LGGNFRLGSFDKLKIQRKGVLKEAKGNNPNPFFKTPEMPVPLISKKANVTLLQLKPTILYDFETQVGKSYTLLGERRDYK